MAENIEQLLENLESALVLNPADPFRRLRLGRMYLTAGKVDKAESAFQRVLQKEPGLADAHHGLGRVREQQGDHSAALGCFQQALTLDANHVGALADLARYHESRQEDALAQGHHDALVRLKPDDLDVLRNAAALQMRLGHFERALPLLEHARKLDPNDAKTSLALGIAYVKNERFVEGRDTLSETCTRSDADAAGLAAFAEALFALAEHERAMTVFQSLLRHDPNAARLGLARSALALDRPAATLDEIAKLEGSAVGSAQASALSARAKLALGEPREALALLAQAQKQSPTEAILHELAGRAELALGRANEAVTCLERALRFEPDSITALLVLADARSALGHHEGALQALQRAALARPNDATLEERVALLTLELGNPRRALDSLRRAFALDPLRAQVCLYAAQCHLKLEEPEPAEAWLGRAVGIDPGFGAAHLLRGEVLLGLGKQQAALLTLEDAARLLPTDANAHALLGRCQQELGRPERAMLAFERAHELSPNDSGVLRGLARASFALAQYGAASAALRSAVALAPNDAAPHFELGLALEAEKLLEPARAALESAARLARSDAAIHVALGRVCLALGDPNAALAALEQADRLAPGDAESCLLLGRSYRVLTRHDEARRALKRALDEEPNSALAHLELGRVLVAQAERDLAQLELARATELDPERADAWFELGQVELELQHHPAAIAALGRATARAPDHVEAYRALAAAAEGAGQLQDAVLACRQLLRRAPEDVRALAHLSQVLEALGRDDEARQALEQALHLSPALPSGELRLGVLLARLGKYAEAARLLERGLATAPDSAGAWDVLANCHEKLGDTANLAQALTRGAEVDPHSGPRLARLGQALTTLERDPEAIRVLEQALGSELEPAPRRTVEQGLAELYRKTAQREASRGDERAALAALLQAERFQGDDVDLKFEIATRARACGEPDRALLAGEQAARLAPRRSDVRLLIAELHQAAREYQATAAAYREVTVLEPSSFSAWLGLGSALQELGQRSEAIEALSRATQIRGDSFEAHALISRELYAARRYPEALRSLEICSKSRPLDSDMSLRLAYCQRDLGNDSAAVGAFERALLQSPKDQSALLELSLALVRLGRHEQATLPLSRLREILPGSARVLTLLGLSFTKLGRDAAAVEALRAGLTLEPNPEAELSLLESLSKTREFAELCRRGRALLQLEPANVRALELCGAAHLALEEEDAAIATYERLLGVAPRHDGATKALAKLRSERAARLDLDSPALALAELELAIEREPGDVNLYHRAASCRRRLGQIQPALDSVLRGLEHDPKHLPSLLLLGSLYASGGIFLDSVSAYERALAVDAECYDALIGCGDSQNEREELEAAVVMYARAARARPDSADAQEKLAALLLELSRPEEGADALLALRALRPLRSGEQRTLGLLLFKLERNPAAAEVLSEALDSLPDDRDCLLALSVVRDRLGQLELAAEHLEHLVALAPDHPSALGLLGRALSRAQRFTDASKALREATRRTPSDVSLMRELALVSRETEEHGVRLGALEALTALEPDNARVWCELGELLAEQGEPEGATVALEHALERAPDPAVAQKLARICLELGQACLGRGQKPAGIARLEQAVRHAASDPALMHACASSLREAGALPAARAACENALALSPNALATRLLLGDILLELREPAEAAQAFELALTRRIDSVEALVGAGRAYTALGDAARAERSLRRAVQLEPQHPGALTLLARSLEAQGQMAEAALIQAAAVQAAPVELREHLKLAAFQTELGKHRESVEVLQAARVLWPSEPEVARALALAYEKVGRIADAVATADTVLAGKPDDLVGLALRARTLGELGRADEALRSAERALALGGPDAALSELAARLYRAEGERLESEHPAAAARAYLAAVSHAGPSSVLRLRAARALRAAQDLHGAAENIRAALAEGGGLDAWLQLGEVEAELGRLSESKQAFQSALEAEPNSAAGWLGLGLALVELKDDDAAREALGRALELRPDARALSALVRLDERAERWADACASLQRLAALRALNVAESRLLGATLLRLARPAEAARAYERLAALEPTESENWIELARARLDSGDAAQAHLALEEAAKLEPEHERLDELLARAEHALARYPEAIAAIERQLRRSPSPELLRLLAECWKLLGRADEYEATLARLAVSRETDAKVFVQLAEARATRGKRREAIESFERARELSGGTEGIERLSELLLDEARAEAKKGRIDIAHALLERGARVAEPDDARLLAIAQQYLEFNELELAGRLAERVAERSPKHLGALLSIGQIRAAQGADQDALRWFAQAVDLKLDATDALVGAGKAELCLGAVRQGRDLLLRALRFDPNLDVAASLLLESVKIKPHLPEAAGSEDWRSELVRLRPRDANAQLELGTARVALGQPAQAIAPLQAALEIAPELTLAHVALAGALAALGRDEESGRAATRALELDPNNRQAMRLLGLARAAGGEVGAAIDALERAYAVEPSAATAERLCQLYVEHAEAAHAHAELAAATLALRRALVLNPEQRAVRLQLARVLLESGHAQDAVETLTSGLREVREELDSWLLLGKTLLDHGRPERAVEAFEVATRLAPTRREAREGLGMALARAGRVEALEVLERGAAAPDASSEAVAELAKVFEQRGDRAGAARELSRLSGLRALDRAEQRRLAFHLAAAGTEAQALAALETALQSDEGDVEVATAVAALARATNQLDRAQRALEFATRAAPERAALWLTLGEVRAQRGQHAEAVVALERANAQGGRTAFASELLAQSFAALGDDTRRLEALRTRAELAPNDASTLVPLGRALLEAASTEEAVTVLEKAHALAPADPEAKLLLSGALLRDARRARERAGPDAAILLLGRALQLDPRLSAAWWELSECQIAAGRTLEAQTPLERLLEISPDHLEALIRLGGLRVMTERYAAALDVARRAAILAPSRPEPLKISIEASSALGTPAETLSGLERLAALEPLGPELSRKQGQLYLEAGRASAAVAAFAEAVRTAPDGVVAWIGYGRALTQEDQLDDAVRAFERALTLEPQNALALRLKANLLHNMGRDPEAVRALRAAIGVAPSPDLFENLAVSLHRMGDEPERMAALLALIEHTPKDPGAHLTYAFARAEAGHTLAAIDAFETALSLDDRLVAARQALVQTAWQDARRLLASNDPRGALELIERAQHHARPSADLLFDRARALHGVDRAADSIDALRRAIQVEPGHRAANIALSQALLAVGRSKEAASVLDSATKHLGDDAEILRLLVQAERSSGRLEQAVHAAQRAAALGSPGVHAELGELYEQLRDYANAADHYRRALPGDPRNADLHWRLGTALSLSGRTDDAIESFERAVREFPGHGRTRLSLGLLYIMRKRLPDAAAEWQALSRIDTGLADQLGRFISQL